LSYNVPEEVMASSSLIKLKGEPIENVRQLNLAHMLSNESSTSSDFIHHQIASAYSKWNELKSIHAGQTNIFIYKLKLPVA